MSESSSMTSGGSTSTETNYLCNVNSPSYSDKDFEEFSQCIESQELPEDDWKKELSTTTIFLLLYNLRFFKS